ncbi:hypothetical protein HBB16_02200 [Pseudonocardia sp. MCCB 268]|nr:hypothetical protein [Pseudonocardia cytotoxica]
MSDIPLDFTTPRLLADQAYIALRDRLIMLGNPAAGMIDDEASRRSSASAAPGAQALSGWRPSASDLLPRRGTFATAVDISDLTDGVRDPARWNPSPRGCHARAGRRLDRPPGRTHALADRIRVLDSADGPHRADALGRQRAPARSTEPPATRTRTPSPGTTTWRPASTACSSNASTTSPGTSTRHCELFVIADGDTQRSRVGVPAARRGFEKAITRRSGEVLARSTTTSTRCIDISISEFSSPTPWKERRHAAARPGCRCPREQNKPSPSRRSWSRTRVR